MRIDFLSTFPIDGNPRQLQSILITTQKNEQMFILMECRLVSFELSNTETWLELKHKECKKWWCSIKNYYNFNFLPVFFCINVSILAFFNQFHRIYFDLFGNIDKLNRNLKKRGKIQIVTILKWISSFVTFLVL